jgi:hypothetical protein
MGWSTINPETGTEKRPATEAVINVGDLEIDDTLSKFSNEDEDGGVVTTDYEIRARYEHNRGIYACGLTSPKGFKNNTTAFVQIHVPVLIWYVDWTASMTDKMPIPPKATPTGEFATNWVLMDDVYEPANVLLLPDGVTPVYRLSGTYVYGCRKAKKDPSQHVTFPLPTFIENSIDRIFPGSVRMKDDVIFVSGAQ